MQSTENVDQLAINTIRTLAMDAVQKAQSGHPGTPMALAPVAYTLWQEILRFDPEDPIWPDRDRFILSAGHASMLLYSLLHLSGVKAVNPAYEVLGSEAVSLDDIRRFRQLDSRTPGHPEYRWTSGVECTAGPLGQGFATSVGMAMAQRWLAARFNRPGYKLFDHQVYALGGDGCLMEGVSAEAASLAGHQRLGNLCWIYDNNRITIEGSTELAFSEDVATRFMAYGWTVSRVSDANDTAMLRRALELARGSARPTLIIVDSHIGWGAPHKQDSPAAHGEPLGAEEIRLTKQAYGWPSEAEFHVPDEVRGRFDAGIRRRGRALRNEWFALFERYAKEYPVQADEVRRLSKRSLPEAWDKDWPAFPADDRGLAGRDASAKVLNEAARRIPWLIGGSADLAPSTKTRLVFEGAGDFSPEDPTGRNLHFGVREHAMTAILNGLSLSKLRPFGSGFLIFSDYAKPAIRLGALMELPVIHVFTHDSIGVGEDGPTHQPVEQLAGLRAIPGLLVLRPCDANEVAESWKLILGLSHQPAALVLSRQALPTLDRAELAAASGLGRGAYILSDDPDPQVILMASGSEVWPALQAAGLMRDQGVRTRVVSMPSWELFEKQDAAYRESVLPRRLRARVAVEQASTLGWDRYVGLDGELVGMRTFGASAPLKALQERFGFTVEGIVAAALRTLTRVV